MIDFKNPVNSHHFYHAHVYFDTDTLKFASDLCARAGKNFDLKVGRVHLKPVGPHPKHSCQISFTDKDFNEFIPWLDKNRNNLSVLVHAQTGDDMKDHTDFAYWLGDSVPLNLSLFKVG
ncbi:4,5-dioxygenase [Pseudoalteromonas sp. NBT06-2]|uniref:DOPA 4,5-dioxygenase family protein n=1 Tax=Pseudoalteromonas sp. NBT06-2 TaxID=2025950 RepID=UPI000BA5B3B5|nr:DOPA 4,5-dioxygenase family protein [Pseudoalteromonas sp. NBT06-2]PAJ75097.1 4,5-dioxygenase [Pseudoalteromonas sp. NBT06-2]